MTKVSDYKAPEVGLPHLRAKLDDLATVISGTEDFEAKLADVLYGMFFQLERLVKKEYK